MIPRQYPDWGTLTVFGFCAIFLAAYFLLLYSVLFALGVISLGPRFAEATPMAAVVSIHPLFQPTATATPWPTPTPEPFYPPGFLVQGKDGDSGKLCYRQEGRSMVILPCATPTPFDCWGQPADCCCTGGVGSCGSTAIPTCVPR